MQFLLPLKNKRSNEQRNKPTFSHSYEIRNVRQIGCYWVKLMFVTAMSSGKLDCHYLCTGHQMRKWQYQSSIGFFLF